MAWRSAGSRRSVPRSACRRRSRPSAVMRTDIGWLFMVANSTTDATTSAIWDMPLVSGKENFIKVNNVGTTLTNVVLSSEPAAL